MSTIQPIHYEIAIEPNFSDFTFKGKAIIHLKAEEEIIKFNLNAKDLTIESCKLLDVVDNQNVTCTMNYNTEEVLLDLPVKISGDFKIEFIYDGKIKDDLAGLYQTRYKVGKDIHVGAITHFETEEARRLLPCFDEPGMKATFSVEIVAEEKFMLVSNTPVIQEEKLSNGKKKVKFDKTPKMSTYLLMLGIAEFETLEDKLGDITVRIVVHPGLLQYAKEAIDFEKKSLDYCQTYFGIPYPLAKLDLISTPDFAYGAMENWGAIVFRENDLLNFPGFTTKTQYNRILSVIAHEITHQWFGNLVSPSIWKYVWLNESFANFFGYKIVDVYYPEIHYWDNVIGLQTNMALLADAYFETAPIEMEGQEKLTYNTKTIPIIYNKGGAMLRMIEDYIGPDLFQKGLHLYLTNHAYDVATSDHLWNALEESSKLPISKLMKIWVLQPGYPLITVSKEGTKLKFSQERFTFLVNHDTSTWIVPLTVLVFNEKNEAVKKKFLLESKEGTFDVGFSFKAFKVNADQTGFYRVKYDQKDLDILGKLVKENKFSTLDSWSLVNDLYALVISGNINIDQYLQFITNYTSEQKHTAIRAISDHLVEFHSLAEGKIKDKITKVGITFNETFLEKIGYEPNPEESSLLSNIRNSLLLNGSLLGSKKTINYCLKEFEAFKKGKNLAPEITDAVLSTAARQTNDLAWFLDRYDNAKNEAEIVTLGAVFGEFSEEDKIDYVLNEIVFPKIPMRNVGTTIRRLCENPHSNEKMWKFYLANLDNFGRLHENIQGRAINSIVSNSLEVKKDMQSFFPDYCKTNPIAKITTEKAFETLEINLKIKKMLSKE